MRFHSRIIPAVMVSLVGLAFASGARAADGANDSTVFGQYTPAGASRSPRPRTAS